MQSAGYGTILIENSITNDQSTQKSWIDLNSPLSFFDFLKNADVSATPKQFNDSYSEYLRSWYAKKGSTSELAQYSIKSQYIDLLKEISLNFTTYE
jgi:hypothetical protein